MSSAKVANNIEDKISVPENCKLTHVLSKAKKSQHKLLGFHLYDVLYFGAMLTALIVSFVAKHDLVFLPILAIAGLLVIRNVLNKQENVEKFEDTNQSNN